MRFDHSYTLHFCHNTYHRYGNCRNCHIEDQMYLSSILDLDNNNLISMMRMLRWQYCYQMFRKDGGMIRFHLIIMFLISSLFYSNLHSNYQLYHKHIQSIHQFNLNKRLTSIILYSFQMLTINITKHQEHHIHNILHFQWMDLQVIHYYNLNQHQSKLQLLLFTYNTNLVPIHI